MLNATFNKYFSYIVRAVATVEADEAVASSDFLREQFFLKAVLKR